MKVILVTGGRTYADRAKVAAVLTEENPNVVMHGDARGADSLAGIWARQNKCFEMRCPAPWESMGKRAGPMRNSLMIYVLEALEIGGDECLVVAFPGGAGTADCVRKAREAGLPVREIPA